MARTNIDIDEDLMRAAMRLTRSKTKRKTVELALRRLVDKASLYTALSKLEGRLSWEGNVRAWRKQRP